MFNLTPDGKTVAGFYTLTSHLIYAADLPESIGGKLPRFPIGTTLLGRMAVDLGFLSQRLGEFLLMHACERAWLGSKQVSSWAILVDANEGSREFYLKYDFSPFPSQPNRLFLPMGKIGSLFSKH